MLEEMQGGVCFNLQSDEPFILLATPLRLPVWRPTSISVRQIVSFYADQSSYDNSQVLLSKSTGHRLSV